jgi:hypothetical protein
VANRGRTDGPVRRDPVFAARTAARAATTTRRFIPLRCSRRARVALFRRASPTTPALQRSRRCRAHRARARRRPAWWASRSRTRIFRSRAAGGRRPDRPG